MHSHVLTLPHDDRFVIQIHGGAWDIPESLRESHRRGVEKAYETAFFLLQKNTPPLETVVAALEVMETDPTFDAGTGSFLNENGDVELDAAVMEGENLRAGAVAAIGSFPHPSRIALHVLEQTEHVLLVGKGAESFAVQAGFCPVDHRSLVHPREILAFEAWVKSGRPSAKVFFSKSEDCLAGENPDKRGTVGAVIGVRKGDGTFALFAGTSTGGIPGKKAGRVGDVPLVGCGLYADNEGACVSCTGWGEGLIRVAAAKTVSERVRAGMHPQEAVTQVLHTLWKRTEGRGGLIAIDFRGRIGAAFSTPDMAYAGAKCECLDIS